MTHDPIRPATAAGGEPMTRTVVLPELPPMGAAFWRGVAPKPPRPPAVAGHQVVVPGHTPEVDRLARYARVCGFTLRNALPPTWLHVLTFPLHVHLLADPATTLPLAGLVHVSNRMRLTRPVLLTEQLEIGCGIGNLRPHRRGALVDLTGQVRVGDELVWEGVSTYLARGTTVNQPTPEGTPISDEGDLDPGVGRDQGRRDPGLRRDDDGEADQRLPEPHRTVPESVEASDAPRTFLRPLDRLWVDQAPGSWAPTALWRLPADLGRRYRDVAGDPNPIHTSRLAAKAFGFPRPIVHGMWTHARLLAALENRLPAAYQVSVEFTKPILLPSTVGFAATADDTGWDAAVTTRDGSKPHLLARIEAAGTADSRPS